LATRNWNTNNIILEQNSAHSESSGTALGTNLGDRLDNVANYSQLLRSFGELSGDLVDLGACLTLARHRRNQHESAATSWACSCARRPIGSGGGQQGLGRPLPPTGSQLGAPNGVGASQCQWAANQHQRAADEQRQELVHGERAAAERVRASSSMLLQSARPSLSHSHSPTPAGCWSAGHARPNSPHSTQVSAAAPLAHKLDAASQPATVGELATGSERAARPKAARPERLVWVLERTDWRARQTGQTQSDGTPLAHTGARFRRSNSPRPASGCSLLVGGGRVAHAARASNLAAPN